jgi:hypothetical protein
MEKQNNISKITLMVIGIMLLEIYGKEVGN